MHLITATKSQSPQELLLAEVNPVIGACLFIGLLKVYNCC